MNASLWLLPVAAYLYGSVPFGFLAAKMFRGVDIRRSGSGNIGATNAARVLGFKFFPLIFLLDVSKGLLPVWAAARLVPPAAFDPAPLVIVTGVVAILGHVFPVYLGFKGGKAVATSTGVFLGLAPLAVLLAAALWAVVFALWRYVSLASICAALALAPAIMATHPDAFGAGLPLTGVAAAGGVFVVSLHRTNIRRLLRGEEHKIGAGRPHPAEEPEGGPDSQ